MQRADLDRALTLKPNYPEALSGARVRAGFGQVTRPVPGPTWAALDHVLPDASDMRLTIGRLLSGHWTIRRRRFRNMIAGSPLIRPTTACRWRSTAAAGRARWPART